MKLIHGSLLFVSLALAAALPGSAEDSSSTTTAPATIFIVRHAEKSAPNGDLPLSAAGRERAQTLATMLAGTGVTHVFTTEMIRAKETAAPLAEKLGLTPTVVPVAQSEALANELKRLPPGAVALVANHSGTIPVVLEKLGAKKPAPIGEEQYDRLFLVTRLGTGQVRALELRYGQPSAPAAH